MCSAFATDAVTATLVGVVALVSVGLGQVVVLNRRLAGVVENGPRAYCGARPGSRSQLPIFVVEAFYYLLTYSDVIVLKQFRPADDVAIYYAAAKTIALVVVHLLFGGADDRAQIRRIRCQRRPRRARRLSQAIRAADLLAVARGDRRSARARPSAAAAVRPRIRLRLLSDVHHRHRALWRAPRSALPNGFSICSASGTPARWFMPPLSLISLILCVLLIPRLGLGGRCGRQARLRWSLNRRASFSSRNTAWDCTASFSAVPRPEMTPETTSSMARL